MVTAKYVWAVICGDSPDGYRMVHRKAYRTYQEARKVAFRAATGKVGVSEPDVITPEVTVWRKGSDYVKIVRMEVM